MNLVNIFFKRAILATAEGPSVALYVTNRLKMMQISLKGGKVSFFV